jgi:hypothetical protein
LLEADAEDSEERGIKSLTIRYYRQYLKGDRRYRDWAKREASEQAADAWESEHGDAARALEGEDGDAPAHR